MNNGTDAAKEQLVKSRQRVADHGEVFTPRWLVDDMLDLVRGETERIDSRFLEPACGSGNFLVQSRYREGLLSSALLAGQAQPRCGSVRVEGRTTLGLLTCSSVKIAVKEVAGTISGQGRC